jgi:hypothetical protein
MAAEHGRHHPRAGRPARRYLRSPARLIHELARYLIDPDLEPDFDLFIEALKTPRGISRFWTGVEADYGTFDDFPDLDLDEVINGRVALLDLCMRAYGVGLTE